jgi:hypothetical protein
VPRGKLATIDEVRACLAKKHGTDIACPMATGIFAWTATQTSRNGGWPALTAVDYCR